MKGNKTMQRVLADNVWQQISPIIRKAKHKIAALAYVSTPSYVTFGKGDILICDASDQAIRSGETSVRYKSEGSFVEKTEAEVRKNLQTIK